MHLFDFIVNHHGLFFSDILGFLAEDAHIPAHISIIFVLGLAVIVTILGCLATGACLY